MAQVAVVFGGPSPEHDVSVLTGLRAARVLSDANEDPLVIYWSRSGEWFSVSPRLEPPDFIEGVPRKARSLQLILGSEAGYYARRRIEVSTLVNCCHGGPGEDGTLQGVWELANMRFTGPGAAMAALGMDKFAFGAVVAGLGLPTLPRALLPDSDSDSTPDFPPPFVVKPRFGGSSIGVRVVETLDDARALVDSSPYMRQGAVLEPFLQGCRDLNIGIRTHPNLELSAVEAPVRSVGSDLYSYVEKYLHPEGLEGAPRELPARIPDNVDRKLRAIARHIARALGLRSVMRLDFLWNGEDLWVNEINTIPGGLAAYLWGDPKTSLKPLLENLIAEAESARPRELSAVGADGRVLLSSPSMAAKLGE